LRHFVVVLAQPFLVGGGLDPPLQRRDDVPHFHRRSSLARGAGYPAATGSKQSRRSPDWSTRSFSQVAPLTATSHVSPAAPGGPVSVHASTKASGTSGATARSGAGSCV